MSGCSRKFSSCGTRSPARTRRCPLMRLRICSCMIFLQKRVATDYTDHTDKRGLHCFESVFLRVNPWLLLKLKASTTPHSGGSTTFLFLSPAARLPEPDDRATPPAAGRLS